MGVRGIGEGGAVLSAGSTGRVARGEFAGLNLREPEAVRCAGGPESITDGCGIGPAGDPGCAAGFRSRTLESNGLSVGSESSTRRVGRLCIVGE